VAGAEDVGQALRLLESAGNAGGSSNSEASPATAAVSAPPEEATSLFTGVQSGVANDPPAARPTALVISIRSVTVDRRGVAAIPVSCPASAAGGCRGKITITITVAQSHTRLARAARCARGCRPLGTTNYEARAGQKVRVRVHIASFGRRLLSAKKSVRVTLTATSVSEGLTATVTRAIALKAQRAEPAEGGSCRAGEALLDDPAVIADPAREADTGHIEAPSGPSRVSQVTPRGPRPCKRGADGRSRAGAGELI
jgi:hypothetical protein